MDQELQASIERLNHMVAALVEESRAASVQFTATVEAYVTRWQTWPQAGEEQTNGTVIP